MDITNDTVQAPKKESKAPEKPLKEKRDSWLWKKFRKLESTKNSNQSIKVESNKEIIAVTGMELKSGINVSSDGKLEATDLPMAWSKALKATFGLPPQLCTVSKVPGYVSPIPTILEDMKTMLTNLNGFHSEGIFRLAPEKQDFDSFKADISSGSDNYKNCDNINCIANAIKVWFRDLPTPLLGSTDYSDINASVLAEGYEKAVAILDSILEPHQSILKWLLDLSVEVIKESATNRMSSEAVSIVMAPNLYKMPAFDPTDLATALAAMKKSKTYTKFWERLIDWRYEMMTKGAESAEDDGKENAGGPEERVEARKSIHNLDIVEEGSSAKTETDDAKQEPSSNLPTDA